MFVCSQCGYSEPGAGFCTQDGTPLAAAEDPLLGQTLGSYRVARVLGRGGMGTVYLGVHPGIGSRVAIKVLTPESSTSSQLVERFFAEARAVNVIKNDNIVNVLDLAALPDGRPYIVMEYLEGAALASVLNQSGPLPLGWLCRLATDVLDALRAAHAHGIVHRDLKPDNVFVTGSGRTKVLDFGIAKLKKDATMLSAETRTGALLGTPQYMSPEQARGQHVDARSDLYSLGMILYEGATGHRPFDAQNLYDLLRQQVELVPSPLRTYRPDAPAALESLVSRALAKDPAQRFQSAQEMAVALARVAPQLAANTWNAPSFSGVAPTLGSQLEARTPPPTPGYTPVPVGTLSGSASVEVRPAEVSSRSRGGVLIALGGIGLLALVALVVAIGGVAFFALRSTPASPATTGTEARASNPAIPEPTSTPGRAVKGTLTGVWNIESASTPGTGAAYSGDVNITARRDGAYSLRWNVGAGETMVGTAIDTGKLLAVGWSASNQHGIVYYEVKGGKLSGRWATAGVSGIGSEELDGPPGLDGTYRITAGNSPYQGGKYAGTVTIKPARGAYDLHWTLTSKESYQGVGILMDDILVVGWGAGNVGAVAYEKRGERLVGRWTMTGAGIGTETLHQR